MIDRGIIKWQPFDSCYSSQQVLKDIISKKNNVLYPILSEDQLNIIQEKIERAYYLQDNINLDYFYNGKILSIMGKINYLDIPRKKIIINNSSINFRQIININ